MLAKRLMVAFSEPERWRVDDERIIRDDGLWVKLQEKTLYVGSADHGRWQDYVQVDWRDELYVLHNAVREFVGVHKPIDDLLGMP